VQRPISCKVGRQPSRRELSAVRPQVPLPAARGQTLVGPERPGKI
jgi:hypothetical protein